MSRENAFEMPAASPVSFSRAGVYSGLVHLCALLVMTGIPLALYGLVRALAVPNPWPFRFFLAALFVFLTAAAALRAGVAKSPASR
jgi:hypothetical protein